MNDASFCELFCARHKCQPADYDQTALRLCYYPKRYHLGRLLTLLNRNYFDMDLALIATVKAQTNARGVRTEIEAYRFNDPPRGLFRGWFRVRISGRRLLNKAEMLFSRAG